MSVALLQPDARAPSLDRYFFSGNAKKCRRLKATRSNIFVCPHRLRCVVETPARSSTPSHRPRFAANICGELPVILSRASRLMSSTSASRSSPLAISKLIRSRTRAPLLKGNDARRDVVPADDPSSLSAPALVDLSPIRKRLPRASSSEEEEERWSSPWLSAEGVPGVSADASV